MWTWNKWVKELFQWHSDCVRVYTSNTRVFRTQPRLNTDIPYPEQTPVFQKWPIHSALYLLRAAYIGFLSFVYTWVYLLYNIILRYFFIYNFCITQKDVNFCNPLITKQNITSRFIPKLSTWLDGGSHNLLSFEMISFSYAFLSLPKNIV